MLKVIMVGAENSAVLHLQTIPIDDVTDELAELMLEARFWVDNPENGAVGLAAPQIGDNHSWFVMKEYRTKSAIIVANPVILGRTGRVRHTERCFSVNKLYTVKRAKSIIASYTAIIGSEAIAVEKRSISGKDAQVFQHEYHHLKGKLISDIAIKH